MVMVEDGRGAVEQGLNEHLVEKKYTFADFYSYDDVMYESSSQKCLITI